MRQRQGVTIIELLLVISLIAIIGATMVPVGSSFLIRNHLKNKLIETVSVLQTARTNAMVGKEHSDWGVLLTNSQIILFKGSSYVSRDSEFDQIFNIPQSITASQQEVVFRRVSGQPDTEAVIVLTAGGERSRQINITPLGVLEVN